MRSRIWLRALRIAVPLYPLVGGVLGVLGWALGVPELLAWHDSGIAMKFNTAVCSALAGAALLLLTLDVWPRVVRALGVFVALVGGLTLLEHLTGANFGIDTLLFHEPPGALATAAPGRMGPPAATSFSLLGAALALACGEARGRRVASALALAPIASAGLAIVGYAYGASELFAIARVTGIALQTATMIAALGIGLVAALPEHGLAGALRRDDPGGVMFRSLLAPMVALSVTLGALRLAGERAGLYDRAFGTASRTLVEIVLLVGLVWLTAARVSRHARQARAAEGALREADRRKDEFLATLAHELRNPLAPLRTSLEIARRNPGDAAAVARAHAVMQRQLDQMVHLVDDLLDLNRIARGRVALRRQPVDVAEVVDKAIETSRPVIEAFGHRLTVVQAAGPGAPIFVDGDVTRLVQVVANLLNNAAKYTDPGGHIRIGVERAAGEVQIKVRDDGAGIPPELQATLFEMFTRSGTGSAGARADGLGIGLALVRQLVESHGGSVGVHSPPAADAVTAGAADGAMPARGSEFVVRLPTVAAGVVERAPLPAAAPAPAPAPAPAGAAVSRPARRRVLIADDNVDAAESLAELLEEMGVETRLAHDGEQAVAVAEAFRPDVAFLDVGMPKLDGHEVGRRIRAQPWGGAVMLVALTGWGQAEDRRRSREAGFDEHLVKPAMPAAVEKVLAAALTDRARPRDAGATA
jgi:signal transduction histidine kinase/ActR/RegA family two-component response regulator